MLQATLPVSNCTVSFFHAWSVHYAPTQVNWCSLPIGFSDIGEFQQNSKEQWLLRLITCNAYTMIDSQQLHWYPSMRMVRKKVKCAMTVMPWVKCHLTGSFLSVRWKHPCYILRFCYIKPNAILIDRYWSKNRVERSLSCLRDKMSKIENSTHVYISWVIITWHMWISAQVKQGQWDSSVYTHACFLIWQQQSDGWDLESVWREPTPESWPLTFTHFVMCMHRHTHFCAHPSTHWHTYVINTIFQVKAETCELFPLRSLWECLFTYIYKGLMLSQSFLWYS